jgi:ribulose 1,5-bisphosphate carboxylase large subunit-like protein
MGLKFLIDILLKDTETMTDERFNHLEAQITELREFVRHSTTAMQENTAAMQENMLVMQQDLNLMREDMTALRERVDIIEGSVSINIREGFNALRNYLDDLSLERAENNRNIFDEDLNQRRLNRRIPAFDKREDD